MSTDSKPGGPVEIWPVDICVKCGLTYQAHVEGKAWNCPYVAGGAA